jgi:hypothetical protein
MLLACSTNGAARAVEVIAPSPLAAEGVIASQQVVMGEGASSSEPFVRRDPLTHISLLNDRAVLSRRGRGHSNGRPNRDEAFA